MQPSIVFRIAAGAVKYRESLSAMQPENFGKLPPIGTD